MNLLSKILFQINFLFVLVLTLFGLFSGIMLDQIVFETDNILMSCGASLIFCIVIAISVKSQRLLCFFLPFVLLAFPIIINNLFPGLFLENQQLEVIFPLFTHIDLYFLLLLGYKYLINRRLVFKPIQYINECVLLFLLSSLVNILYSRGFNDVLLLISGMYPIRYCLLIQLFLANFRINYEYLIEGLFFCIFFLFLESSVYTIMSDKNVLSSGSLGINTFGNIVGQITLLLLYYYYTKREKIKNRIFKLLAIVIGLIVVVLSQTRMALLAMFIVSGIIIYPKLTIKYKFLIVLLIGFFLTFLIDMKDLGKYDIKAVFDNISFSSGDELTDIVNVTRTELTSSIFTRLKLFQTSINMFSENIFTGIGYGLFNVRKYEYGFDEQVIIDSHNGYLFLLAQLGIIGVLFIYLIYIYPIYIFIRTKFFHIKCICFTNLGMAICDLSNAGIFKYSVLSFLLFNSLLLLYIKRYGCVPAHEASNSSLHR